MKHPDNVEHLYYFELFLLTFFMIAGGLIVFMVIFNSEPIPPVNTKEVISVGKHEN